MNREWLTMTRIIRVTAQFEKNRRNLDQGQRKKKCPIEPGEVDNDSYQTSNIQIGQFFFLSPLVEVPSGFSELRCYSYDTSHSRPKKQLDKISVCYSYDTSHCQPLPVHLNIFFPFALGRGSLRFFRNAHHEMSHSSCDHIMCISLIIG